MVAAALDHIARPAGRPLAQLDPGKRDPVVHEFRASGGVPTTTLARVIQQCYCRGDRALRSLGRESRAPLPRGHVLPDTATSRCSARSRRGELGAESQATTATLALSDSSGLLISTILSLPTFAVVPRPCQTFLDEKSGSGRSDGSWRPNEAYPVTPAVPGAYLLFTASEAAIVDCFFDCLIPTPTNSATTRKTRASPYPPSTAQWRPLRAAVCKFWFTCRYARAVARSNHNRQITPHENLCRDLSGHARLSCAHQDRLRLSGARPGPRRERWCNFIPNRGLM
jgi:hypothetical protein